MNLHVVSNLYEYRNPIPMQHKMANESGNSERLVGHFGTLNLSVHSVEQVKPHGIISTW